MRVGISRAVAIVVIGVLVPFCSAGDVSVAVDVDINAPKTVAEEEVIVATTDEGQAEIAVTDHIVHEAFVQTPVAPEPVVVPEEPPRVLQETIVIETKPVPEAIWVDGYWYYQRTAKRFIWVTGGWRVPPPDAAAWVPTHYAKTSRGWVLVHGYWQPSGMKVIYIEKPPPPRRVEVVEVVARPGHLWVSAYWHWEAGRREYVWHAGSWVSVRAGYVYVPPTYRYTPKGYVLVAGYYDRPLTKRGVVYRPMVVDNPHSVRVVRPTTVLTIKTRDRIVRSKEGRIRRVRVRPDEASPRARVIKSGKAPSAEAAPGGKPRPGRKGGEPDAQRTPSKKKSKAGK